MKINGARQGEDITVVTRLPEGLKHDEKPRVTMFLRNVSALTVLRYATEISEMNYTAAEDGIAIHL